VGITSSSLGIHGRKVAQAIPFSKASSWLLVGEGKTADKTTAAAEPDLVSDEDMSTEAPPADTQKTTSKKKKKKKKSKKKAIADEDDDLASEATDRKLQTLEHNATGGSMLSQLDADAAQSASGDENSDDNEEDKFEAVEDTSLDAQLGVTGVSEMVKEHQVDAASPALPSPAAQSPQQAQPPQAQRGTGAAAAPEEAGRPAVELPEKAEVPPEVLSNLLRASDAAVRRDADALLTSKVVGKKHTPAAKKHATSADKKVAAQHAKAAHGQEQVRKGCLSMSVCTGSGICAACKSQCLALRRG
jgi:hypothetical protein